MEIWNLQDTNAQLDKKCLDLQRKLQNSDPKILKDQKDLIHDLKSKVTVLERELQIVHNNSDKEIERLRLENESLLAQKTDDDFSKDMQQHMEKMTLQKLRQELINAKSELDQAAKQVSVLNEEVQVQQSYYEKEMAKLKEQVEERRGVLGVDNETINVA